MALLCRVLPQDWGGRGDGQRRSLCIEVRPTELEELKTRLRRLLHKETDDLRIYPLCEACLRKTTTLGKAKVTRRHPYVVVGE